MRRWRESSLRAYSDGESGQGRRAIERPYLVDDSDLARRRLVDMSPELQKGTEFERINAIPLQFPERGHPP